MRILTEKITKKQLLADSAVIFDGPMIKAVVDIDKSIIGVDANMHADIEQFLLSQGSEQKYLWGINLYPEDEEDFVEFDSMINVRPRQGNSSRDVEDESTRSQILSTVTQWIS